MEIEKIQKWLFNFLRFQPKKDIEDKIEGLVAEFNRINSIWKMKKVEDNRADVERILGDAFLKILEISNDLKMDLVTILKERYKLGV